MVVRTARVILHVGASHLWGLPEPATRATDSWQGRGWRAVLDEGKGLWRGRSADFLADSGSSAAKYLERIQRAGFTHWSVSNNKWTTVLDRTAEAQPEGAAEAFDFAAVRFRAPGELFWRYRVVACEGRHGGGSAAVFARHWLKGEKEGLLKEVLRGLDLHHPPCAELVARAPYFPVLIAPSRRFSRPAGQTSPSWQEMLSCTGRQGGGNSQGTGCRRCRR